MSTFTEKVYSVVKKIPKYPATVLFAPTEKLADITEEKIRKRKYWKVKV